MTKDLLSRTIISIGVLVVFIILAVGSVDTDSVDSPSSSSPKTYKPSKPSKPKRPDLNATVVFTGSQFVISNHNNFDWTNVKLEINSGIIRGGHTLRTGRGGLPPFYVPVVMRVFHTHSPCLEKGGA